MDEQRQALVTTLEDAKEARALAPAAAALELTAEQILARKATIQRVMRQVMKRGVHYGVIAGDKPSLLKPGSEELLVTFRIAVKPSIDDLSTDDCIRYRVTVAGVHQVTGVVIGYGLGECSSDEEKYRWRRAVNSNEWNDTAPDRRRRKYGQGKRGAYTIEQVRTNPADVANTILKMAKKRAQVDLTLTSLSASDVFDQDLEDLEGAIDISQAREAGGGGGAQGPAWPDDDEPGAAVSVADLEQQIAGILGANDANRVHDLVSRAPEKDRPRLRKAISERMRELSRA